MIIDSRITKEKIELRGPVKYVYKQMGKAILDYKMLEEGDRILIGVSGGADSLSLLRLFLLRKARIPMKNFTFLVCFVDADFITMDKKIVFDYFGSLGVEYVVKPLSLAKEDITCFWCSWNRRKILFETARDLGCNKVALGHNLDDVVETTLLNLFFHGEVSTMKPRMELFKGKLTIIRPFAYVDKQTIFRCADKLNIPYTKYNCPFGKDSKRASIKDIISRLEELNPDVKKNILRAPKRIKMGYI